MNNFRRLILPAVAAVGIVGCGRGDSKRGGVGEDGGDSSSAAQPQKPKPIELAPLAARSTAEGEALFTRLPADQAGVAFQPEVEPEHPLQRLRHSAFACGSVALGDVDGDGRLDLFVAGGASENRLYLQSADDLKFADATAAAGVGGGSNWGAGGCFVDIEGDGDLDLYVCNYGAPNQLFANDGAGRFEERAGALGLAVNDACLMASFCDYDNDGDLDCFILTNRSYRPDGTADPSAELGRPDYLLRNDGGSFVDTSQAAGVALDGPGISSSWWDYDSDGDLDLYVSNDIPVPDRLLQNNGDGTFTDVIRDAVNDTPWLSRGSAAGDVDGDGTPDLLVLGAAEDSRVDPETDAGARNGVMRNVLYLGTGTGRLVETARLSGVARTGGSWAAEWADFDNDGRLDLFVSNAAPPKSASAPGAEGESDRAFRNIGGLRFEEVSGAWGLDDVGVSSAAASGDLDRDGDLDLVVAELGGSVTIYRNDDGAGHRAIVGLRGAGGNSAAVGALVTLETAAGTQVKQMMPAAGRMSASVPELHFGLGEAATIEKLTVRWPSGRRQDFDKLAADQRITVSELPEGVEAPAERRRPPMFAPSQKLLEMRHVERPFDDFGRQPLLPRKLSQLGPGLGFADVDGDGDDDIFLGRARGASGRIEFNQGFDEANQPIFEAGLPAPFDSDADSEDMGVLFFDADGDTDLDLYIASGSYEYEAGDPLLLDRLYINAGNGEFSKAEGDALPDLRDSSSCVCAADFDRDGDLDLFVGGRVLSGEYPLPANSRLLLNESQPGLPRFVEAPAERASGLRQCGLVTSALWSDVDGDSWVDLLVTLEWGPVKLFKNDAGTLRDATAEAGLQGRLGWWNSIAGGDIDNDGDIDYAVGNAGLNSGYRASAEEPALIVHGDSGDDRYRWECNTLASGILINDGKGRFEFSPLPDIAQAAPVFGLVLFDADADEFLDLAAVGNFSQTRSGDGPSAGGIGVLLGGRGNGTFEALAPSESGFVVAGDGRSLALCDLNGDNVLDLVAGVNDGALHAFLRNRSGAPRIEPRRYLAPAERDWVAVSKTAMRAVEGYAGGGYLSQSTAASAAGQLPPRKSRLSP